MADTIQEHIHMLNLIQNHDTRALEQLMEHHLTVAQNINLELLK